jgi:hypothetical protein
LADEGWNGAFVAGFEGNVLRRQVAAYRGAANVRSDRHGEHVARWLLVLFANESPLVRCETININWTDILDATMDRTALVKAYLS